MFLRKTALVIICSFLLLSLAAQLQLFQTYTINDGLVDNRVRNIYQDKNGFIWIGTWEGVSRYDGHKFTNFSTSNGLSHDLVNDFIEEDNKLFIALNNGSVDQIENSRVKQLENFSQPLNKFIRLPDGRIIMPSDAIGFHELKNGKITKPVQENSRSNSQLLLPLDDQYLLSVDVGSSLLTVFSKDYKQLASAGVFYSTGGINSIYKDTRQRIWLCTDKGLRLFYFNPGNSQFTIELPPPGLVPPALVNIPAFSIFQTDDGIYWISNATGLVQLKSPVNFKIFTTKDGLTESPITSIISDRENNLWMGTASGLIKLVRQREIENISAAGLKNRELLHFTQIQNGQLLLSANSGPKIYNPFTNSIKEMLPPSKNNPLIYQEGSNPRVFIRIDGYFQLDSQNKRVLPLLKFRQLLTSQPISDAQGNGFAGFLEGKIVVLSKGKVRLINPSVEDRVTCLSIDRQGYLWVGTWSSGLYRVRYKIDNDSISMVAKNYSHLVADTAIRSLYTSKDGTIWVGTRYKGAYRLQQTAADKYATEGFDKSSGLSSNFITAFAESGDNDMWIGSLYGLDKLIKTTNGYRVFNFSRINNVMGVVYQIKAAGNNSWWCNIENNLVSITDHFLEKKEAIPPIITRIRLGPAGKSVETFSSGATVSLKYNQNQAQFEFAAPGFINESQILYSYRLLGSNDSSWSDPRNIHEVFLASLQPGSYTFQVRTLGWNDEYSAPASFKFEIRPPFWQTWWFILLCLFTIAAFFYLLYRYRLKQILKVQAVRNRIATDLHDDIGSNLTNIGILTELTHLNLNDKNEAEKHLKRIAEEINESGQALDDIIWNVNSKNDTLDEMIIRMRRYAAELFDHTDTHCQLSMPKEMANFKIGMEQRRDLYLLFKESLNNIYKHASANNIEVILDAEGQKVHLLIRDNGIGFDTDAETHRNGLKNLKKRVEKWKGSISVTSEKGKGTTIDINIPVT